MGLADTWIPALPATLTDQQVAEILILQELLANRRSSKEPIMRGCGAALISLLLLHNDFFGTRKTRRIRSSYNGAV